MGPGDKHRDDTGGWGGCSGGTTSVGVAGDGDTKSRLASACSLGAGLATLTVMAAEAAIHGGSPSTWRFEF
jgi:hypothetical protein